MHKDVFEGSSSSSEQVHHSVAHAESDASDPERRSLRSEIEASLQQEPSEERKQQMTRQLHDVVDIFNEIHIPYFIVAGAGLDLQDGSWDRDHQDIDTAIFEEHKVSFVRQLAAKGFRFSGEDVSIDIDPEDLVSSPVENVFVHGEKKDGSSVMIEVIFMPHSDEGVLLGNDVEASDTMVVVPKDLYVNAKRVDVEGKEIVLGPSEVTMYFKLLDGRRKDLVDLSQLWASYTPAQKQTVRDIVARSGLSFDLLGRKTDSVDALLRGAVDVEAEKRDVFFDEDVVRYREEERAGFGSLFDAAYAVSDSIADKKSFVEHMYASVGTPTQEQMRLIQQMGDLLYHGERPARDQFRERMHDLIDYDERIKERVMAAYQNEKIWTHQVSES